MGPTEVENLTDAISLNHNWCNSVNLPRMYESMKEGMAEVKAALSDVEEMLSEQGRGTSGAADGQEDDGPPPPPWQFEFWRLVQLVSRCDAGWAWKQFWQMVERWLKKTATEQKKEEARLHPDLDTFVLPRLKDIIADFDKQSERPWLDEETLRAWKSCGDIVQSGIQ